MKSDIGKTELKTAVNLWCRNKYEAVQKYGDISLWDTSVITDMSHLFFWKKRFNGNITKVSEFTGMERTALYRKLKSLNIKID